MRMGNKSNTQLQIKVMNMIKSTGYESERIIVFMLYASPFTATQ